MIGYDRSVSFKLILVDLAIPALPITSPNFEASFDIAQSKYLRIEHHHRFINRHRDLLNLDSKLVLKILFQVVLADEVRNLIQEESALSVISLEKVCGLHPFYHVLVLVLGPNVFVVEGSADARL